ncbi:MAG: TetR/AcrR family transcriptional regulator, partial [Gammaproteobacteria bacterium]|nr:TetR/AcrR family transcriptional regulator [Gammaproteobacteria bacterium]
YQLFKENGFYATGVDLIMRSANVSKRTLYKYFPSKNDLIVAVIDEYRSMYRIHIEALLSSINGDSREKIDAIFADAMSWFGDTNFHGCLAVNAMGEFANKNQEIEQACLCFKHWELNMLCGLTRELDDQQPDKLAYKLFVLLEGMSSIAQVSDQDCAVDMVAMANQVIDMHLQEMNSSQQS